MSRVNLRDTFWEEELKAMRLGGGEGGGEPFGSAQRKPQQSKG